MHYIPLASRELNKYTGCILCNCTISQVMLKCVCEWPRSQVEFHARIQIFLFLIPMPCVGGASRTVLSSQTDQQLPRQGLNKVQSPPSNQETSTGDARK